MTSKTKREAYAHTNTQKVCCIVFDKFRSSQYIMQNRLHIVKGFVENLKNFWENFLGMLYTLKARQLR